MSWWSPCVPWPMLVERLAAVGRSERAGVEQVDGVLAVRVRGDVGVVERALPEAAGRVHQRPARAGIVGRVEAAVLVLDQRVDAIRVRARDGDADPADDAGRQTLGAGDLRPGLAAVGGLEQPAARAAARHLVLDPVRLPQRRVHHAGVAPIDDDVHGAGLVVAVEHLLPRLAAVGALEQAALLARHAVAPEAGDEDDVVVGGVNADAWRWRPTRGSRGATRSSPRRSTCRRRHRA